MSNDNNMFTKIYGRALKRYGSEASLHADLPKTVSLKKLEKTSNAECLSMMTKCIFRSGFHWRVVEAKWPVMSEVLQDFDPELMAGLTHGDLERLLEDKRVIRNEKKLRSIAVNAQFVLEFSEAFGSFAHFLADWPTEETVDLWHTLNKHGNRLGPSTSAFFLREIGKDTFLITRDVIHALKELGVIAGMPTSKKDLKAMQDLFNEWRQETSLPLAHLSKILALSIY